MSDNAEEGIARAQAAAARAGGDQGKALSQHHQRSISYIDERIMVFLLALGCIGLMILWATAKSPLLLYGSLAGVFVLLILWGYARVRRIERERAERARQAEQWNSQSGS